MAYQVPNNAGEGYVTVAPAMAKVVVELVILDELVASNALGSERASEMLSDSLCDGRLLRDAEDAAHYGSVASCISDFKGSAG